MKKFNDWIAAMMAWLAGDTFFFTMEQVPSNILLETVNERIPWLSDTELASMMTAMETEQVNRLAERAGYYDTELEAWVTPLDMATYPSHQVRH